MGKVRAIAKVARTITPKIIKILQENGCISEATSSNIGAFLTELELGWGSLEALALDICEGAAVNAGLPRSFGHAMYNALQILT